MQTIQEFIKAHKLNMASKRVENNPNFSADNNKEMLHFAVIITGSNKTRPNMSTYWSCGTRFVEIWAKSKPAPGEKLNMNRVRSRNMFKDTPPRTLAHKNAIKYASQFFRPCLADVLDSLASDASTLYQFQSFADWADELGYDSDSISAHKTWRAVQDNTSNLAKCIGYQAMIELIEQTERL